MVRNEPIMVTIPERDARLGGSYDYERFLSCGEDPDPDCRPDFSDRMVDELPGGEVGLALVATGSRTLPFLASAGAGAGGAGGSGFCLGPGAPLCATVAVVIGGKFIQNIMYDERLVEVSVDQDDGDAAVTPPEAAPEPTAPTEPATSAAGGTRGPPRGDEGCIDRCAVPDPATAVRAPYRRLEDLPGVGPSIAGDLRRIGVLRPSELGSLDPEALYERLQDVDGPTDRCVLYVFRCAQYAVTNSDPNPELLRWWNWKDAP